MTTEALIREHFDAFNEDGVEAILHYYHPDMVWHAAPEWVGPATYRGHDGARALVSEWTESFDDYRWETHAIVDAGDTAVALAHHHGRSRDGLEIGMPIAAVMELRGGRIQSVRFFFSWEQALDAAGLYRLLAPSPTR